MSAYPTGWVSRETITGSVGGQDHLSTEVGWQRTPSDPQKPSSYPHVREEQSGAAAEHAPVPDDVSRETLSQDQDHE